MSARNTLKSKAIRREERDQNRRAQLRQQLAGRVGSAAVHEQLNALAAQGFLTRKKETNEDEPGPAEEN